MEIVTHIVIKDGQGYIESKHHLKAEMVARMVTDGGYTVEAVMAHYGLTAGEVHAALAYYYDNKADLDAAHDKIVAEIHDNAMTLEKFKVKIAAKPHSTP